MRDTSDAFYELAPHLVDFDVDEEGVREFGGRRMVFLDVNVFAKIFDNMEDIAGPVIQTRIKEFGVKAGKNIGDKVDAEFEDVDNLQKLELLLKSRFKIGALQKIKNTDSRSQLQKILGYGTYAGWMGETEIMEYSEGEKLQIKAYNTFESHSYGDTGRKECKFLQGVLQGLMKHFWQMEVDSEELECACESVDNDFCLYEVTATDGS